MWIDSCTLHFPQLLVEMQQQPKRFIMCAGFVSQFAPKKDGHVYKTFEKPSFFWGGAGSLSCLLGTNVVLVPAPSRTLECVLFAGAFVDYPHVLNARVLSLSDESEQKFRRRDLGIDFFFWEER